MDLETPAATCRECGRAPGAGRFCASCGARIEATPAARDAGTDRPEGRAVADVVEAAPDATTRDRGTRGARGRRSRIGAALVLVGVVGLAVWLQQPRPRDVERAGGLATYGGSTSDERASLTRVRWAVPVPGADTPVDVQAVVSSAGSTAVVTEEAVWVLAEALDGIEAELPRYAGVPRPGPGGRLALLHGDRLLEIDPATAEIVGRSRLDRSVTTAPTWGQPTSGGWGFTEPDPAGDATFVHARTDGEVWSVAGVSPGRVVEVGDVLVFDAPGEVRAYDAADGDRRWIVTGARVVTAGGDLVVVERSGGELAGLSTRTGVHVWRLDADGRQLLGANAAGILLEEVGGGLVALDPATGRETLRFAAPEGEDGRPLPGSRPLGDQLVAGDRETVIFDPGGRVRWRIDDRQVLDLDADGDVVVVTTPTGVRVLQGAFGEPDLPLLPPYARAAGRGRPAVSGAVVRPSPELTLALADGSVIEEDDGPSDPSVTVLGLSDGFWQRHRGRSLVRDRDGEVRWQSGGGTVPVPLADTPHGVVAVLDDGAIGAVRLLDPTTGFPIGPGVLDAGLVSARPVDAELVVGTWRDLATDETWTVGIAASAAGLEERWRSPVVGDVVGRTGDLVWIAQPGRLVGIDAASGDQARAVEVPALASTTALVDGTAVLVTDTRVIGVGLPDGRSWEVGLDGRPTAAPVVGGDRVHVGLEDGRLVTIDAQGRVVDERSVSDASIRSLVVTGRVLLVRTAGTLVAVGD